MLGAYFVRKRRKKGLSSKVHFVFLVLSLRLKRWLRFVLRIIDKLIAKHQEKNKENDTMETEAITIGAMTIVNASRNKSMEETA